jgi:hypothetical protein
MRGNFTASHAYEQESIKTVFLGDKAGAKRGIVIAGRKR